MVWVKQGLIIVPEQQAPWIGTHATLPAVRRLDDRDQDGTWRMWYVSGTEWSEEPEGPRHRFHITYAESRDGRRWERTGIVCLDYGRRGDCLYMLYSGNDYGRTGIGLALGA